MDRMEKYSNNTVHVITRSFRRLGAAAALRECCNRIGEYRCLCFNIATIFFYVLFHVLAWSLPPVKEIIFSSCT